MSGAREGGWIDVSRPLDPRRLVVWPGDRPLEAWLDARIDPAGGSVANVTAATLSLHTGTHIDAPRHFLPEGKTVEEIDLDICSGPARLVRHLPDRHIAEGDVDRLPIAGARRVLFATTNGPRLVSPRFEPGYVALLPDAARRLVELGVGLVGIDYLSIGPPGPEGDEVHRVLLGAGVVILEGLVLQGREPGEYELAAFPLAVKGSDGAPVRAALRRLAR